MAEYYVVRDKNTGLYFRGKGVNRWGKYYNQASVYRVRANAENTIKEVSWRGEQAEVVPIQIIESTAIEILSDLKKEIHEKAVYPQCRDIPAYVTLREFDAIIANLSNRLYEKSKGVKYEY